MDLKQIIEAALAKGRKQIVETNDEEIDDWDPEEGVFRRLDEAKPVKPMKPLKPGETREDAEIASDPNHEQHDAQATAELTAEVDAELDQTEADAPKDNSAVDRAQEILNAKDPKAAVKQQGVKAAQAALKKP